ncbi:uncharacterized protein EDB91DRAFT_315577 [Suillus paluster]|uniref:uncharacterized protein n=1 Tax=Suillus paluster TaxID=48578 RepID=UPI001B86C070|nr:uncharacterized protein EDB91DRAFT_315577 [Suillus paluster]KAG1741800.1 hypothetical protein EDB91DRAFT_315577 [Suillus paluster]
MVFLGFYLFVSIIPCISTILAVQVHPVARVVTSSATCINEYSWMNDAQGYSPCLTVAYVEASCIGNNYEQPALMVGYSYSLPNSSTANACYCSWSSYNLLMACTLCQGFTDSVWTWPTWASGCSANSSWIEEYFPSQYVLAGNASIPYWAIKNPMNWTYETFNIQDASAIYEQNPVNVIPGTSSTSSSSISSSSSSNSKSTDVTAIVGGTIGSVAALSLLAIGAYLMYRRHLYKKGLYASVVNQQAFIARGDGTTTRLTPNRRPSNTSNFSPSVFGSPVLYGHLSPSQYVYSPRPQMAYPSLQGSLSPPPRANTTPYTTHSRQQQRCDAIPMI